MKAKSSPLSFLKYISFSNDNPPVENKIKNTIKGCLSQPKVVIAFLLAMLILVLPVHSLKAESTHELNVPPELINRAPKKRNPSMLSSADWALRCSKKNEILLIDVRGHEEFERIRIPGSMNVPLFAIKTKTFLKPKPLVLVNEGYSYAPLERACKDLRECGFKVSILTGGLNSWKQAGGPLEGDPFAQRELNRMPVRVFFEERNYEEWVVVDASESPIPDSRHLIPEGIHIPFSHNRRDFISGLRSASAEDKSKSPVSFLIFNEAGGQYEEIEAAAQEAKLKNVFFLRGGLQGYKTFLQRQALIWQAEHQAEKRLKKCASCP